MIASEAAAALHRLSRTKVTARAVVKPPRSAVYRGLNTKIVQKWQLLVGLSLSVALCLSCPSAGFLESSPLVNLSPEVASCMGIDASTLTFQDLTTSVLSPRIPSLIFPLLKGARLLEPLFRARWKDFSQVIRGRGITATEAVQMARRGFVPHLSSPPIQTRVPTEPIWDLEKLTVMTDLVAKRLASGIVETIPTPDFSSAHTQFAIATAMCYYGGVPWLVPSMILPFVSILFPVPKPHQPGVFRDVMGMSAFNDYVEPKKFKMEGLHTVRQLLRPLDHMVVIDVDSAFPTMGINPRYRDYFIFRFRGQFYRYRGAVFGISSLPRAWKKLLSPVIGFLRSFGIRLAVFVDDLWVCASTYIQCVQDAQDIIVILWWLGFNVAPKCLPTLIPSQIVVWNGVEIDSVLMEFRMGSVRIRKIIKVCARAFKSHQNNVDLTLRQWASVLGVCRASMCAILPALLWTQAIKRLINARVSGKASWDLKIPSKSVPQEVLDNLKIWISPRLKQHNGRPIRRPPADVFTDSDASGFGGGMVLTSPPFAESRIHFDKIMQKWHINPKELVMHLKGIQGLELQLPGLAFSHVFQNRTDNSVSMSTAREGV